MNRRRLLTEYIRDDADEELDYLTLIPWCEEGDMCYIKLYWLRAADAYGSYAVNIWYSIDNGVWIEALDGEIVSVPGNHKIRLKCNGYECLKGLDISSISYVSPATFGTEYMSYYIQMEGTPLSLLHGDNFKEKKDELSFGCFFNMFYDNQCMLQINNPKTFIPSTELAEYCYAGMFSFSHILNAPELPAETLKDYCYYQMFQGCVYLEEAPELKAKVNSNQCYASMFMYCYNLKYIKINAPENFYEYDYDSIVYGVSGGIAVLPSSLLGTDLYYNLSFAQFAIVEEGYPTNDEGYPDTKQYQQYYNTYVNLDYVSHDENSSMAYYRKEANDVCKSLYDNIIREGYIYDAVWFNRKRPKREVSIYEDENGNVVIRCWIPSMFSYDYTEPLLLHSDGSCDFETFNPLMLEYIKK